MTIKNTKNQNILASLALTLSLILCIELIILGYTNYNKEHVSDFTKGLFHLHSTFNFRLSLEYIGLNIFYLIWLIQNKKDAKSHSFRNIIKCTYLFVTIAFVAYPTTKDVYLYLQYGLMDLNGINPFINAAGTFSSKLSPLLDWKQSSTYGPVSQLFFMAAASFISINLVSGVYVFKIICLALHVVNGYLIWQHLKLFPHQSKITIAYLVNPVLLLEHVTNAHTDVFICTGLICLIRCLKYRHYVAAFLTIWVGFLTKTLPIIWLPLVSVFLVRQQRWKSLLVATFISLAIIVACYCSILPTAGAWKSLLNQGVKGQTTGSLHNVIWTALDNSQYFSPRLITHLKQIILSIFNCNILSYFGYCYTWVLSKPLKRIIISAFTIITYSGFALYYTWVLFKPYFKRGYSEANLILSIGWVTLVLLLFSAPWYQPWYPSILLPITALNINSRHFVITSLTFCLSSSCSYYALGYGPDFFGVIGSLFAVGPAIVVLLFGTRLWALK